jgi:FtsH-binding integral membrane protein
MSQANNPYAPYGSNTAVAYSPAAERSAFIKKTYIHLGAAVYGFAAILYALFATGAAQQIVEKMLSFQYSWLLIMGAFVFVSYLANSWAVSTTSIGKQYAGLFLYVLAEAIIFLPILSIALAQEQALNVNILGPAIVITLIVFAGLTAAVFMTGADFSFLRTGLMYAGFGAMGLVICAVMFGFNLGMFFTVAMIVFAGAYILYDTSNILHHYRTDQYVAAALALFASVALLFFYILRLVMDNRR